MRQKTDRVLSAFDLRQPWIISLVLVMCIPLFPEYIAPFLAVGSLFAAARDAHRHHRRVRVGAAGKAMIAFLAFMTVHLLWADDRLFSGFTCLCWMAMLCAYLSISTILTNRRRVEAMLFALSTVVGILGILACLQYGMIAFGGKDVNFSMAWYEIDRALYDRFPFKMDLGSGLNRSCATFTNPNLLGQFMTLSIPLVAAYGFSGRRSAAKVLSRVWLLFAVAGLLLSFSRGAYLALGAVAIVMCIANIRRLVPILTVLASVVMLIPDTVYMRLTSLGDAADNSILERFELWGIAMQLFLEAPLFGHGIGVSTTFEALQNAGYYNAHMHNLFLQILVEGGVLGLLLLLFILWKLFRTGFELIIHAPKTRMYGAAIIAFCAGLCVCGLFDYPLFTPKLVGMLMVVLGLTDALGFLQVKHASCTVAQALPFYGPVHDRLEAWVRKKTAPKDEREKGNEE